MEIFTATLAVGLSLAFAATALPSAEVPPPRGPQGLPGPGPTSPPAAPAPDVVLAPPDEGPDAATILLIALGGALALTGVAYIVTRAAQHRRALS